MDEEAEQQLTAQLSGGGGGGGQQQQLDATTASASPASHQQRRSLASLLSIKREPRRPKTPSVVVTDETTHLVSVSRVKSSKSSIQITTRDSHFSSVGADGHSGDESNQFKLQEQIE
ncbi:hypothetical protein DAPPUDRAFT_114028 [Daphnia pulex]|uniref:Uncharacterized protein n=1 Tax=Daphnia pulex TaxID=6669 RepID=E9HGT6_DAPPU|nr:hypothetical protein DAPPUDRAFT_114028 [Daphnia pulex]|eukprot:EFX69059.1 hypothetical protein DAPPUDRAFT_114028 [Daphnia pulex]